MKESSKGKNIVIVLLFLVILCLGGFIVYTNTNLFQQVQSGEKQTNQEEENQTDEKEIDINSRLVQTLYKSVTDSKGMTKDFIISPHWMYSSQDKILVSSMEEESKMSLVYINLPWNAFSHVDCKSEGIDASKVIDNISYGSCLPNESETSDYYNAISKEEVENVYYKLFGTSKKIDTSIPINTTGGKSVVYVYIPQLNQYIRYFFITGGAIQGEVTAKITRAVQKEDQLQIYEQVTTTGLENQEENYIYTFKLEKDGMYTFYSREKQKGSL